MMNGFGYMDGWGGWAFGGGMMILWFALFVGLIVLLVRWIGGTNQQYDEPDAIELLEQRYARGEIDTAEFEERKKRLQANR